ncbi:hypothetical protein [Fictibacillus sp. NRS-1165]|uniref:hypothetical protein n=1 Tax=Fictibacillus sp. NRS-1165 TaxID=3144463 RepID=UPI003D219CEC
MRERILTHGSRVPFYLKKSLPHEFLDWINQQSEITDFVLYAIEELYKKTGPIDIGSILPKNHKFQLVEGAEGDNTPEPPKLAQIANTDVRETDTPPKEWDTIDDLDDDYS